MKMILQTAAILPFLASCCIASQSSVSCRTELGTSSVKHVPTSTVTKTDPHQVTVSKIIHPTVTVYDGFWYTITRFATKTKTTTDNAVTDTFTSTTTSFSVETDTITATVTTTETDTVTESSTSTTEVATTAGFRNIQDTLNSANLYRRAAGNPHAPRKAAAKKGMAVFTHPVKVDCTKVVPNTKTKTVTVTKPAVTNTIPYFRTTTKTYTITSTSTVVPADVSVTLTSTSTSSVTTFTTTYQTETDTATTTTTSVISGPTVYDACTPQNIFGPNFRHGGVGYVAVNVANNGPGVGSDFKTLADGASTAVDCCNSCQQYGACETYLFRSVGRNCFLLTHDGETCSSQFNHPNYILSQKGSDTGAGYVVGNGNCGYTYSGNSDGSVYTVDN